MSAALRELLPLIMLSYKIYYSKVHDHLSPWTACNPNGVGCFRFLALCRKLLCLWT
jgi:hypothetical protein